MIEQRKTALRERALRVIADSYTVKWTNLVRGDTAFNIAIQIHSELDIENLQVLELSKTLDNYYAGVVHSNAELIEICDQLYEHIAYHYTRHDVHIDIVNNNQPVLSTTYINK